MDFREIWYEVADWIQLAGDRVQWWAVLNTVRNLADFITSEEFLNQLCEYQLLVKEFGPWS
jgi:hypothetical protein